MSGNQKDTSNASIAPLLGGIAGGSASTILLYPLDLIKVRLQVNEEPRSKKLKAKAAAAAAQPPAAGTSLSTTEKTPKTATTTAPSPAKRKNILKGGKFMFTVRGVVKHEGILGLYQGLTPALLANAVSWGGYFFFYEGIKKRLVQQKQQQQQLQHEHDNEKMQEKIKLGHLENFGAACASGLIMVMFTNPLWLIKTRMQLQMKRVQSSNGGLVGGQHVKSPYRGLIDAGRTIVKEEGMLALYKGAVPAMMLVSHGGVQFVSYEYLKGRFGAKSRAVGFGEDGEKIGLLQRLKDSFGYLTMGATSKVIASTTTYPLQVIKSRLQQRSEMVELSEAGDLSVVHRKYKGLKDCITRIWKKEGITGFFKGNIPNAIRVAPSAAITFVVYESVMDMLR